MKLTTGSKKADKVIDLILKVIIVHLTILMIYSTVATVSSPYVYRMYDSSYYHANRLTGGPPAKAEETYICKNHHQSHLYYYDSSEKVKNSFGTILFSVALIFMTAILAFTSIFESSTIANVSFQLLSVANYILLILVFYFVWKHQNKAPPKKRKRIITWNFLAFVLGASIVIRASFLILQ